MDQKPIVETLPYRDHSNGDWSFLNGFKLKTVRDVFAYVSQNPGIEISELYNVMEQQIIKPPASQWSKEGRKKKDRLKLEYLHTSEFLGLVRTDQKRLYCDTRDFTIEKTAIINENAGRDFSREIASPNLSNVEIESFLPIVLNYTRLKDYLFWFLPFEKYSNIGQFDLFNFYEDSAPIYLKKIAGAKAFEEIYRTIDKMIWRIPFEDDSQTQKRSNDYTRLATFLCPSWLTELKVLNTMQVFEEFGFDKGKWILHYPLKRKTVPIAEFSDFIIRNFKLERKDNVVWLPIIIYKAAIEFFIPISEIKRLILELYESDPSKYIMERSSLQVMEYGGRIRKYESYQDLLIEHRGFLRNNLIILNT